MIPWHALLFGCSQLAFHIAPLFFLLFMLMDGKVDGLHFDRMPSPRQAFLKDVHVWFMWRRIATGGLLFLCTGLLMTLALVLIFPWAHDGKYYEQRHDLDPNIYPNGFFSEPSATSTAIFDLSLRIRAGMAIIGLCLIIVAHILR